MSSRFPRRVRDTEDAHDLVARWKESGEPLGSWCERNGIVRQSLQWWRGRGAGSASGVGTVVRVAEVVLAAPAAEYRIVLTNGREIMVGDFEFDVLADLIAVVES
jgi:hypothetical protein